VLLAVLAVGAVLTAVTPMGRYLARGAWAEGRILARRRPIAQIAADSTLAPATRAKLQLVLEARAFAADSLGLPAKDAFTQFTQLEHDTLVLVLSGAHRDALRAVTWWFPVVGRVPYKGFFDFALAQRAEKELAAEGYDTYLRPSPAFSTLGFFNDPLLSTTLGEDSLEIVNTVVHELTHNRFYASGEAVFNESFANFVGARGAWRNDGATTCSSARSGIAPTARSTRRSTRMRARPARRRGSRRATRSTRGRGGGSSIRSGRGSRRSTRGMRSACGSTTRR